MKFSKKSLLKHPKVRSLNMRLASIVVRLIIRAVLFTCKKRIIGKEAYLKTARSEKTILLHWHNKLILCPRFFGTLDKKIYYYVLMSESRDGDWLAALAKCYKNASLIRVPKDKKHHPLRIFIRKIEKMNVGVITPDGPRGPLYQLKPGVIIAAHAAKAKIATFSWQASKRWTLPTWDKMEIPKPFSTLTFIFGQPFSLPSLKKEPLENQVKLLEESLSKLQVKS